MKRLTGMLLLLGMGSLASSGWGAPPRAAEVPAAKAKSKPAGTQDMAAGFEELFAASTKSTPPAVAAARARYDALKKRQPNEPRVDYAFGLALANQHRYREALPLVARYAAAMPADLEAARVHIWLLIEQRNYRGALDEATNLAERLAKLRDADARVEGTVYLGKVFGFFEVARTDAIDAAQLVERKKRVLDLLGSDQLAVLDEGRAVVSGRLGELQTERREKNNQVLAEVDKKQDKAKSAIEGETRRIEVNEQLSESSKEQLREAQRELGVIRLQLTSLEADRLQVTNQIIVVQTQITSIQQESMRTDRPTGNNGQPARGTFQPVVTLDPRLIPLNVTFAALNKQAFDMDRRLLALRARAAELGGKSAGEATTLDESSAAIRKAEKRTRALEKQVKQLERKTPALRASVTPEMTRFGTYLPFPFEEESQRVLDWFAN